MTNLTTFAPKKSAVKNLVIFNRTFITRLII